MSGITKTEFLTRYNDGKGVFAVEGGKIGQSETRLGLSGRDSNAAFVKDMSALSPQEFSEVAALMDNDAKKAYLYNKYPDFFEKWDHGEGFWNLQLSGSIVPDEIRRVGGMNAMLADLEKVVTDPRDRELLAGMSYLLSNDGQMNRMKEAMRPDASQPLDSAFKK